MATTYYVIVKRVASQNLSYFDEVYMRLVTLKVEGPNYDILGDMPFD